jgi:ubiquinol-cytochrome c reductase cytochrome b subunit
MYYLGDKCSYWGATVIYKFGRAVPLIGDKILLLLWGSFFISQPTLARFFVLSFFFTCSIIGFYVMIHLALLHVISF